MPRYTLTVPATLAFDVDADTEDAARQKAIRSLTFNGCCLSDLLALYSPYLTIPLNATLQVVDEYTPKEAAPECP